MRVTTIKQQLKRVDRYSVFVDGKYAFSLSDTALLDSRLTPGQELDEARLKDLKRLSDDDRLYGQLLRYIAIRPRSRWEIEFYLTRKKASQAQAEEILNKLSKIGLIDDMKFAQALVHDRRLLRPTARRKLIQQLRQKRVADEVIQAALGDDPEDERAALRSVIERKRRQPKYRDDLKLMQYLARQGFSYGDIKTALQEN